MRIARTLLALVAALLLALALAAPVGADYVLPVYGDPCRAIVYPDQYGQFDPYYVDICPAPPAPPPPPEPRHHCPVGHRCPELWHP
jgi:hypothetical protein